MERENPGIPTGLLPRILLLAFKAWYTVTSVYDYTVMSDHYIVLNVLDVGLANFFYKGSVSKYFRLCRPLTVQLLSRVWLFVTPWTTARQVPLSSTFSEFAQTHVLWVGYAIQPSHPLSPSSLPVFSLSQHQGLFQWISCSYQVTKILELQLQHQSMSIQGSFPLQIDWFDLLVVILLLSYVWLFVTPWTAAHQAPMFSAISWSLLKFMSVESVMLSNYLILCHLLLLLPSVFPTFRVLSSELAGLPQVAKVFGASASDLPVNTQGWFCYL